MNMQILANAFEAAAKVLRADGETLTAKNRETKVAGPKETKSKVKAKPVDEDEEELIEEDEDTLDDEEVDELEENDDDDLDADDDEVPEIGKPEILKAFKKHISTFKVKGKTDAAAGRKDAMKILKSFKVTSVDALKKSDYSKVMEKLEG
jgi:hypothetical protein